MIAAPTGFPWSILLFDGETTFGWRAAHRADWKVVDAALTATEGEPGLLHTTSQFGNYVLKVDFRSEKQGNSGVFLRTSPKPADDFTWFAMTLHDDDRHMAAWVNGYQVSDWTDTRPPDENPRRGLRLQPGTIQIQGHDPTTDFSFRKLRIAELPPR